MRHILILLCAVLSLTSLFKLFALRTYDSAKSFYQSSDFVNNPQSVYSLELANEIKNASSVVLSTNDSKKLEASYLIDLAKGMSDPGEQIRVYCRAFSVLNDIVATEPRDAKSLINWLDVSDIISGTQCSANISDQQRKNIIETAVKFDPTNTDVLYSAGLLSVWANEPEEAEKLFHDVLMLSTSLPKGKEITILNAINSKESLKKIIPDRFPQIIYWSALLKDKKPAIYDQSKEVLEEMQLAAINSSAAEVQKNKNLIKIHLKNLESILTYAVNSKVRKATFEMIADTIGTKTELGSYFKEKSNLSPVRTVKAFKAYDTLPLKGVLADWDSNKSVVFDTNETSLGFYKSSDDIVKIVEIVSSSSAGVVNPGELKFFISNDNQLWKEIVLPYKLIGNPNINKNYVIIDFKTSDFKYFKVNFNAPLKRAEFWNNAKEIINVFG